jgi:hypothetical protein
VTALVLERGTPTPPGTLVFVPVDGRRIVPPSRLMLTGLPRAAVAVELERRLLAGDPVPARADWVLVPALVSLRTEFNTLSPNRDKASDGSVGDTSHAASSSDHNPDESGATPYEDSDRINEVHAIDVDNTGPWPPGVTFQRIIDGIVAEHRAGRDDRLQMVIYNRRIISRSWGWDSWHAYTGSNPHDKHAHFSCRYTTAQESDTSPWGVAARREDDDMPITAAEFEKIRQIVREERNPDKIQRWYPSTGVRVPADPNNGHLMTVDSALEYAVKFAEAVDYRDRTTVAPTVAGLAATLNGIATAVAAIAKNVAADDADLPQILAAIEETRLGNPGQTPEQIASALRTLLGDRAAEVGAILAAGQ